MSNLYTNAKNIKSELDAYVLGQDEGTKMVSMAIAQHIQAFEHYKKSPREKQNQTDNILIVGPTGSGKTETFRRLKSLQEDFGVPVLMFNILDYAPTKSWHGTSITSIFSKIFEESAIIYNTTYNSPIPVSLAKQKEYITDIANHAVVLLDEFDKIAIHGDDKSRAFLHDYQSNLLKIVEGNTYDVGSFSNGSDDDSEEETIDNVMLDSSHMMFVFLGAFDGIEAITRYRLLQEEIKKQHKNTPEHSCYQGTHIGFLTKPQSITEQKPEYTYQEMIPSQEDLINYGIMRELCGRIAVRTVYKPLDEKALIKIMLHSKTSAYHQWQRRFRQNGHDLKCDHSALYEIAHIAVERGTGARGLMNVFSELLMPVQFELSGNEHPIRCLLRGKEIVANKPPLLHDRSELERKKKILFEKQFLKTIKKVYKRKKN